MKIGIDISASKVSQAGTAIYMTSLVKALQNYDTENDYLVFAVNHQRDMSTQKSWRTRFNTVYRDIVWTHGILPWKVSQERVDLLHMPANKIPLLSPCKTVVSILDTTILQFPEKFPFWHRNYARIFSPLAAKHASLILTISEQSKQDIVKHLNVVPDKVIVTYLGAAPEFQPIPAQEIAEIQQKYHLDTFVLNVGTLEPRKNMIRLLQAFAQLRQNGFSGKLVHAGPKGWLFDDILAEVSRLQLQEVVLFLGRVPLTDLVGLYNAATLFVYPSLYEGFGIPVLEAMASGCPVVTSNISSLPEVAGEAGLLVDPYNVAELTGAMQQVLENPKLTQDLRQRGFARARLFSWERCAKETIAAYKQAFNQ